MDSDPKGNRGERRGKNRETRGKKKKNKKQAARDEKQEPRDEMPTERPASPWPNACPALLLLTSPLSPSSLPPLHPTSARLPNSRDAARARRRHRLRLGPRFSSPSARPPASLAIDRRRTRPLRRKGQRRRAREASRSRCARARWVTARGRSRRPADRPGARTRRRRAPERMAALTALLDVAWAVVAAFLRRTTCARGGGGEAGMLESGRRGSRETAAGHSASEGRDAGPATSGRHAPGSSPGRAACS